MPRPPEQSPTARPPPASRRPLDVSDPEALRTKDFDAMTEAEICRAKEVVARMSFFIEPVPIRRTRPAARGAADLRATLRAALRGGGRERPPL